MLGKFKDKLLLESSLAGDEQAFGELYDRYVRDIYRYVLFRVSNIEEAQDLTSEVFLKTWLYLSSGDKDVDNFKSLLFKIARNITVDYYREKGRFAAVLLADKQWERIIDESHQVEDRVKFKDDLLQVKRALESLPADERDLIAMKYVDDLSIKEISQVLDKAKGTVRVALHRALGKLKAVLKGQE